MALYRIKFDKKLSGKVFAASAATHPDELGNPPHYGTVRKLREENIPLVPHRARLLNFSDEEKYDYIIGMDQENLRHMRRILGPRDNLYLLMDFTGRPRAIADPWYTGNFDETFEDIREGLDAFFAFLIGTGKI